MKYIRPWEWGEMGSVRQKLEGNYDSAIPAKISRAGTGLGAIGWVGPLAADGGDRALRGL